MNKYLYCKNPKKIRDSLFDEAKAFKPHLIHLQIQHTSVIDSTTIRRIKTALPQTIITNWTGDVRNYIPHTYRRIAEISDYNFISSTGQVEMFKEGIGKDIRYWQIGYNPALYGPPDSPAQVKDLKYDAVFIGHFTKKEDYPGSNDRVETCRLLRERFEDRFLLFGNGWPRNLKSKGSVDQRSVSKIYQQSVCSVSVSHYNDLEHYFSDRLLMCMASGRPTVALRFPKWETYFTNMCDLVIVDSIKDIPDAVQMLKDNPELANYIGQQGAAKAFAEHTYYSRVKELLNVLGLA
jgi:spore maturation protein CgeB